MRSFLARCLQKSCLLAFSAFLIALPAVADGVDLVDRTDKPLTAEARLMPERQMQIVAGGDGRIADLRIAPGEHFTQGEVLAVVEQEGRPTSVYAPWNGTLTQRPVRRGQRVRTGDPLLTVVGDGPLLARLDVPGPEAQDLRQGGDIRLESDSGALFHGRIRQLETAPDGHVEVTVEAAPAPEDVYPGDLVRLVVEKPL